MTLVDKLELGPLATFVPNKHLPVYNWFYYKEGFSRDLVNHLLEIFKPKSVLDPFCGVGTTNLACKESGISSSGTDVSPLAVLASNVKCSEYAIRELDNNMNALQEKRFFPVQETFPRELKKFYPPRVADDLLFFRQALTELPLPIREFFQLALITASARCSFIYRDGAVLKVVHKPLPPFRHYYFRLLKRMIAEYRGLSEDKIPVPVTIHHADARKLPFAGGTFDAVITSPPYLNKIEYQSVYWPEEQLFFGGRSFPALRSFIGQNSAADFPGLKQPSAKAYFSDMKKVLAELYRVCRPGANLAFVIGNACFPDGVVDCDTILSDLAVSVGFQPGDIWCVSTRWCTRNRVEKVGQMRESIVFLKK